MLPSRQQADPLELYETCPEQKREKRSAVMFSFEDDVGTTGITVRWLSHAMYIHVHHTCTHQLVTLLFSRHSRQQPGVRVVLPCPSLRWSFMIRSGASEVARTPRMDFACARRGYHLAVSAFCEFLTEGDPCERNLHLQYIRLEFTENVSQGLRAA